MATQGVVCCLGEMDGHSSWALTSSGKVRLQVTRIVHRSTRVVQPRPDTSPIDFSVIELHCKLEADGWTCRVKDAGFGRDKCEPYVVGEPKVWWLRASQDNFQRLYFVALMKASDHKLPVKHWSSNKYYEALIGGRHMCTHVSPVKACLTSAASTDRRGLGSLASVVAVVRSVLANVDG